jgi:hypothetical protein
MTIKMRFNVKNQVELDLACAQMIGAEIPEKGWAITVQDFQSKRSLEQNRYIFSQVYTPIAQQMGEATGKLIKTEVIHEFMKSMFSPRVRWEFAGVVKYVPKSTTKFTVPEFSDYIEKCTAWANENGVYFDGQV